MESGGADPHIGRRGLLIVRAGDNRDVMLIEVQVIDARSDDSGNAQFLVMPQSGRGAAWVRPAEVLFSPQWRRQRAINDPTGYWC